MKQNRQTRSGAGRNRRPSPVAPIAVICAIALLLGGLSAWASRLARTEGAADGLRISEVMTSNSTALTLEDNSQPDWIELENASNRSVNLTGYALMKESQPAHAFVFPTAALGPGERVLVYCDGSDRSVVDGRWHAPFRLSAAGDSIALLDRRGAGADLVTTPSLARDQVYCRDVSGEWAVSDFPTPGEANRVGLYSDAAGAGEIEIASAALEITEVMSHNATFFADESGEHPDYVEIHNASDAPVSLEGWALSDSRNKLRKWEFPAVTLPADGYLPVHCSGTPRGDDPAHLHAAFRLNRGGEEVFLSDPDGAVASQVVVPELSADQAYSLVDGAWTSSQAPSPGQPNDADGAEAAADEILTQNDRGVYITELLATSNQSRDWIELYNGSKQAADLSGCWLSDNAAKPRKWQFPSGTVIQPGAYLGVFADGAGASSGGQLHASFALGADGGYSIALSDPKGHIFDRLYVPKQYQNISFGRTEALKGARYFENPTPGSANAGASYRGLAPQPTFSTPGGLYHSGDELTVALSAPAGCRVYYTLDCTDPTDASALYTEPIRITQTTILRARAYQDGCLPSYMDAQSYLFDVNNGSGTLYVVSLVSDPYNLTSDEYGIMATGKKSSDAKTENYWKDWEREAHVEVFAPDGSAMLSQECGTKLHGNSGRARDQKALNVIARNRYGSNRFKASLFTRRPYTEYRSFILRCGSQDANRTRMRDPMLQQIAAGTSVMYQEYEIGELYLNGVFWGHYNLREHIDPVSICQFEGWEGDEDDIDFIQRNSTVRQGSNASMAALLDWLNAHEGEWNTDAAYEKIDSIVDIQNYMEFMAMEIYLGNTDVGNVKRYRNPNRDGKWHWILYDLDMTFYKDTNSIRRWLTPGGTGNIKAIDNMLFVACMCNERIRAQFLGILGHLMATSCSTRNIVQMAESFHNRMQPILPDQFERWNQNPENYEDAVKDLVQFANTRPVRMLQFLKGCEYLKLTRDEMQQYFGDVMASLGMSYETIRGE